MRSANAVAMRGAVAAVATKRIDAGRSAPFRFHLPKFQPPLESIAASLGNLLLAPCLHLAFTRTPPSNIVLSHLAPLAACSPPRLYSAEASPPHPKPK